MLLVHKSLICIRCVNELIIWFKKSIHVYFTSLSKPKVPNNEIFMSFPTKHHHKHTFQISKEITNFLTFPLNEHEFLFLKWSQNYIRLDWEKYWWIWQAIGDRGENLFCFFFFFFCGIWFVIIFKSNDQTHVTLQKICHIISTLISKTAKAIYIAASL